MAWRLAESLKVLRSQVNSAAPNRSKAADGTIGDTAHAASRSDHNPNQAGVVCALDVTHDPDNGADCNVWAEQVRTSGHPAFKYVIFASRIASAAKGGEWRPYGGSNKHNSHMHVSVGVGSDGRSTGPYDDTSPWHIGGVQPTQPEQPTAPSAPSGPRLLRKGMRGEDVRAVQERLLALGYDLGPHGADGIFGDATDAAVRALQTAAGIGIDGVVGPDTGSALVRPAPIPPAPAAPTPAPQAPPFPLPEGSYFGPRSGPNESVSGYHSHREDLRVWQQRMIDRGWNLGEGGADGLYGPDTERVAGQFQREKGLHVDGRIGPETWAAAWTAPVT